MEEKKHKKKRIKEVSDSKDANKVDCDKSEVGSEVGKEISSVNGDKKRKRKREGSGIDVVNAAEVVANDDGERKKKKKAKHNDSIVDAQQEVAESNLLEEVLVKKNDDKKEEEGKRKKKKKKEEMDDENGDQTEKDRRKKKKNKKKKKEKADNLAANSEEGDDEHVRRSNQIEERKKKRHKDKQKVGKKENAENAKKNKRSKKKNSTLPSKRGKRVTFAEDVQVFPATNDEEGDNSARNCEIVHTKRFSPEEDELVKEAVFKYIESCGLGKGGLDMVLHCQRHPEVRNCWKVIGSYIPWRPNRTVYRRAQNIFKRSEKTTWSHEECEIIRNFHEKHGPDWKTLALTLGRHPLHIRDTWRRIRLENTKKGRWSQDEYKCLFESVNLDLRMRSLEEEVFDPKYRNLRDNIPWSAISQKLSTRNGALCCTKWYKQLTSPLVSMGMWADTDDYRLVDALVSVDACSMEDVDWENLIEHRSGDVCRRRWYQMVNQIGDQGIKSFPELVDIMSKRYCPELIDAREAWDEKLREAKEAKTDD